MKGLKGMTVCLAAALFLSGCGAAGQGGLSDENRMLIAEYAAGLLLKYDQNYEKTLADLPRVKEQPKTADDAEGAQEADDQGGTPAEEIIPEATVEDILGLTDKGITLSYEGYRVCPSYPEAAEEKFFVMDATAGRELYVFSFIVTNTSQEDQMCDILSADAKFRFRFNGKGQENALTTMLLDDLQTMQENIAPGDQRRAVLVLEREQGLADSVEEVSLLVRGADQTAVMELN